MRGDDFVLFIILGALFASCLWAMIRKDKEIARQAEEEKRIQEEMARHKSCALGATDIVGVTDKNDNGTRRQAILKQLVGWLEKGHDVFFLCRRTGHPLVAVFGCKAVEKKNEFGDDEIEYKELGQVGYLSPELCSDVIRKIGYAVDFSLEFEAFTYFEDDEGKEMIGLRVSVVANWYEAPTVGKK